MGKKKRRLDRSRNLTYHDKRVSPETPNIHLRYIIGFLKILSLAILVLLLYANTLESPFIFDDKSNIEDNPQIRLTGLSLEGLKNAAFQTNSFSRPFPKMTFALNYYVHRYNLTGYHLVNILVHLATGLFLYFLLKTTLNISPPRAQNKFYNWIPFVTVLVWLIHPIQTQSVTYIVQRMNSMEAMFYVLSLLLYARARLAKKKGKKWFLFTGCLLSGILSLGSKEIAAMLPFFIILYEWYFFQDLRRPQFKTHILPFFGILAFLFLLAMMYLGADPLEKISMDYMAYDFTMPQRVLTEFRVVIFYLSLLLYPHPSRLNLDHDFSISLSLIDPMTTLLSLGLIAGLVGLAIFKAKKEPLLSFCILWFFGNLVIESSVIGIEIIYEHRIYLPSMFAILMAVTWVLGSMKWKWLRIGALCAVVTVFSYWTHERNRTWGDDETLWRDCAMKSPEKARPHYNLGVILGDRGRVEEAIELYQMTVRIKPDHEKANNNLGNALIRLGRHDEAVDHFKKALKKNPNYGDAHNNLANVLTELGRPEEAMHHYSEVLRIKPELVEAHHNFGYFLLGLGRLDEAAGHFYEALKMRPNLAVAHYGLGNTLARQGKLEEAEKHYDAALRISPDHIEAHNNLGSVLVNQGKIEEAMNHFREALRIKPDYSKAHVNIGNVYLVQGKSDKAIRLFSVALRNRPDDADAHFSMGNAMAGQGKFIEAKKHFSEALRLKPTFRKADFNLKRVKKILGESVEAANQIRQ